MTERIPKIALVGGVILAPFFLAFLAYPDRDISPIQLIWEA